MCVGLWTTTLAYRQKITRNWKRPLHNLRDSEVDCIHKYLSAKFSDEAIEALVKEMEGRHDE